MSSDSENTCSLTCSTIHRSLLTVVLFMTGSVRLLCDGACHITIGDLHAMAARAVVISIATLCVPRGIRLHAGIAVTGDAFLPFCNRVGHGRRTGTEKSRQNQNPEANDRQPFRFHDFHTPE
jgi:hypothetical protein